MDNTTRRIGDVILSIENGLICKGEAMYHLRTLRNEIVDGHIDGECRDLINHVYAAIALVEDNFKCSPNATGA